MSKWALAVFEAAVVRSRDTVGWDDPLSEARAWIVQAESEAGAAFVWIRWYRKHADSSAPSLEKQLRTVQSLRAIFIDCYQPGQSAFRTSNDCPSSPPVRRQTPSMDIVEWDDPLCHPIRIGLAIR